MLHFRRSLRHGRRLVAVTVGTTTSGWMERRRSKLHRHYYDPKRVGSYGGVAALQRVVPAERDVERWLSTQDAYTLHKPVRRHFKRRCVVVGGPNQQWQADLVDMSRLKTANDGTTFLLTVIDVFSKRAWCIPLKSKSAASLVAAFRRLLNDVNIPTTLQTDKGSEFLNRPLQRLLKEYGVHHFATHSEETKASVVERFNRSLKTRMWRYFTKKQTMAAGTGTTVVVRPSIESAIACASARRNVTSRKVPWRTGRKNCLRSSTRTVRIRPFIDWSTGTALIGRLAPSNAPGLHLGEMALVSVTPDDIDVRSQIDVLLVPVTERNAGK